MLVRRGQFALEYIDFWHGA